jgi:hypothetical protein
LQSLLHSSLLSPSSSSSSNLLAATAAFFSPSLFQSLTSSSPSPSSLSSSSSSSSPVPSAPKGVRCVHSAFSFPRQLDLNGSPGADLDSLAVGPEAEEEKELRLYESEDMLCV